MDPRKNTLVRTLIFLTASITAASASHANPDQAKLYKQVFGGDKPKCLACHVDKLPKKAEGKHDLNEYGKKAAALKSPPDEAAYRQAGPAPE
jgi:hypothetical protein